MLHFGLSLAVQMNESYVLQLDGVVKRTVLCL